MDSLKLKTVREHNNMTDKEKLEFLKDKVKKVCVNAHPSFRYEPKIIDDRPVPGQREKVQQWYRHPDLMNMSEEAFENGEDWFYTKPKNPNNPYGKQIKADPEYEYEISSLNQEEYDMIFGEEKDD